MSPGLSITNAKSSSKKEEAYIHTHTQCKMQSKHEYEGRNISGNDRETTSIKYFHRTEHGYRTSSGYGDDSDLFTVLRRKNHRCRKESETAKWLAKHKAQRTK
jgi:hypothetical protein